jgi:hypothetical protein
MGRFGFPDGTKPPVHIDGKTESLASGLHRAALQLVGRSDVPTPMQAMQIEHGRLLKAFREAEGRDPDPNFDPHFWDAYTRILKHRAGSEYGVESAEEYSNFQKRRNPDGWVDPEEDPEDRIEKAIAEGRAPAWAPGLMARRRRR